MYDTVKELVSEQYRLITKTLLYRYVSRYLCRQCLTNPLYQLRIILEQLQNFCCLIFKDKHNAWCLHLRLVGASPYLRVCVLMISAWRRSVVNCGLPSSTCRHKRQSFTTFTGSIAMILTGYIDNCLIYRFVVPICWKRTLKPFINRVKLQVS